MRPVAHPDLPSEQAYVDHAYACLDRMRETLEQAGHAGVGEVAAAALEAFSAKRLHTFVQDVGANAQMSSICDGDLSIGLSHALALFQSACGGILL